MSVIIDWNGHEVPEQLEELPRGRYIVVPVEGAPLTEDEDAGLRSALDAAEAGRVRPAEEIRRRLQDIVTRCR